MRRHSLLSIVSILALVAAPASVGLAQPTPRLADPADDVDVDEDEDWDEEDEDWDEEDEDWGEEEEEPAGGGATRPPVADPEDVSEEEPLDEPEPGDDQSLLDSAAPSSDPTRAAWTSPQSVLTLHGYLRVRGELQDNFFLDHRNTWPFSLWVPGSSEASVEGNCNGEAMEGGTGTCGRSDRLRYANMRVRLQPTLALSDDVRVHMTIDVLDNAVLGSSPDRVINGGIPAGGVDGPPIDFGSTGVSSTSSGDAFRDSIYVRRAWAEVTNRALGQLRFGRMAHEWGLGMLYNAGDNLDGDYSSEIDRIQAITRYSNLFFGASYDFAGEGVVMSPLTNLRAVPFDFTGADDIRQFSFLAAYRMGEEEQEERLANGDWVLNAGLYFLYRKQRLGSELALDRDDEVSSLDGLLVRRNARQVTPDVWVQFLWGDLRLELEAAMHIGSIRNTQRTEFRDEDRRILSGGFALQAEYRLLDEALGIYLDTGLATGDSQARGISNRENTYQQEDGNRRLTHFGFHPNYRIDLILFRNVLGNIGGVYYLRPGLSYDLVRTAFGQRVGARVDVIYSRANRTSQIREYGDRNNNNLGLELDASVYYRSEDGPGLTDGFYAAFQYGILFPLAGLKESGLGVGNAQTLRLILGVEY
ncbi:MAG: TIGR04551 family protein [Sandaracinaceae bacterium]|nr:TIGR04551 family protein [Myxococcales bacterium]MCB9659296.1 TIGR04551 family protein [Sandaracinaceae bacterium]